MKTSTEAENQKNIDLFFDGPQDFSHGKCNIGDNSEEDYFKFDRTIQTKKLQFEMDKFQFHKDQEAARFIIWAVTVSILLFFISRIMR